MDKSSSKPEDGLVFSDNISVKWQAAVKSPDAELLSLVNESNQAFLRAVAAVSAPPGELAEENAAIVQEIGRLDLKINLLLELVGQLVYAQLEIPARTRATISSDGIEWHSNELPEPGQTVFMQVYIQHGTPKPLCFYGEVVSEQAEHATGKARVRYLGLSEQTRGWLEKLIFRHHRRQVAFKKSVTADT
ncbi:PilZ domain-containing protein [Pseudohalioglobus lutimaris]|uniref:Cyclic di-GMP receptor atypical PilZ domain-containing protein n=1 Tax=Pseudohalioglobus lutimaris TaxID=1737061 RepID=A0A2N5X1G1_9GAMM|nr:PilZ domain-containing protein [Pseudohalioglobus lutimaris]PLW68290.1 hypothetical protein C0039_12900 [Pseudohalioglobus lutimaris]